MEIRRTNEEMLLEALRRTSADFDYNIEFNNFKLKRKAVGQRTNTFQVTLKVKNSSEVGARRSFEGRKMISACWHVYGTFIDHVLDVNPNQVVVTTRKGKKTPIKSKADNWQDWNIGSPIYPFYYSEACKC